jgi:hypothetical protein
MLRGKGSNLRPSGYEPDELPLLYLAMYWGAKVGAWAEVTKSYFIYHSSVLCLIEAPPPALISLIIPLPL